MMLTSNSSSCNPFAENDLTSLPQPDPNFFFTFPNSPHLQYDDVSYLDHFLDTFSHHQSFNITTSTAVTAPVAAAAKKDRHSKINTARGPRDRRMRLSLDIARKFFDLQDLLGYDKASRTVDWLLRSSQSAIRELARAASCGGSSTSEECLTTDKMAVAVETECCSKSSNSRKGKRGRVQQQQQQRRVSVDRESRKKARERARDRTSQKKRLMRENSNANAAAGFGESHHFLMKEDSSSISGATNEDVFFFNFHNDNNNNAAFLHQDEQIAGFQFNGKAPESYTSFNLS